MKIWLDTARAHSLALAIGLLAFASLLMLSPQWGMLLSNSDDPWIVRSTWNEIQQTASSQGRFWLIPINVMAGLPYKLGGWALGNATKIAVNGLTLLSFTIFLSRLVNLRYALVCVLAWLALMDVSNGYYSAFHGFSLMFNLQMGTLFLSLWWYLGAIDAGKSGFQLAGPYLLFGFALLAYEPMLFFAAAYFAAALYRRHTDPANEAATTARQRLRELIRWTTGWIAANWMLLAVVFAYLAAYFSYRHFLATSTRGIDLGGEVSDIVKTIYRFSVYGFHFEFSPLSRLLDETSSLQTAVISIGFGLCLALAGLLLLPATDRDTREQALRTPAALAFIAFFVFSPNILHGFVEGYRQWAAESPYYVGNYLSSFALAILAANGMVALVGGAKTRQEPLLFALVVYLLASSATDNMHRWSTLAETNRRDGKLWMQAIAELRPPIATSSGDTLHICGKDAPEKVSGDDTFWSYELSRELGKKIEFLSKRLNSARCDLVIDFNRYRQPSR